jgi:hypothetical protein
VPVAGPRRIEPGVDPRGGEGGARRAFGQRRAADIAEAQEQYGGDFVAIVVHFAPFAPEVEPTFNLRLCAALLAMARTR